MAKFQVMLGGEWKDYCNDEDNILKSAHMAGLPTAEFRLRGQNYICDFRNMVQRNKETGKEYKIREPMKRKPSKPSAPHGPTTVVNVPPGGPGKTICTPHPHVKGAFLSITVPASARVGQAMLVPVPDVTALGSTPSKGKRVSGMPPPSSCKAAEEILRVATPQAVAPTKGTEVKGSKSSSGSGWSTGGKVAIGTAAGLAVGVGGLAVAGAILGEHGSDATADAAGDEAVDAVDADFAADGVEFAVDAGDDAGDIVIDLF